MQRFQRILYVSQGTDDEMAGLKQALSLARNNRGSLHVLVVSPNLPSSLAERLEVYQTSLAEHLHKGLQQARSALNMGADEPAATVEVECGKAPAVSIVRRVLRDRYDLVIKQAQGLRTRAGFQAIDMQLLRLCSVPVWLSRPIERPRKEIRVAVAIDPLDPEPSGAQLSADLLKLARPLADDCSGELHVISCWDYEFEDYLRYQPWMNVTDEELDASVANADREHRMALDGVLREAKIAGRVRIHRARGRPDRTIARVAEDQDIDILVMGTVARTGLSGFVMGNTAESTLQKIHCSVVALKPRGFISAV